MLVFCLQYCIGYNMAQYSKVVLNFTNPMFLSEVYSKCLGIIVHNVQHPYSRTLVIYVYIPSLTLNEW